MTKHGLNDPLLSLPNAPSVLCFNKDEFMKVCPCTICIRPHIINSLFPGRPHGPPPSPPSKLLSRPPPKNVFVHSCQNKTKYLIKYFFNNKKTGFVGKFFTFCGQKMAKILLLKIKSSLQNVIR